MDSPASLIDRDERVAWVAIGSAEAPITAAAHEHRTEAQAL